MNVRPGRLAGLLAVGLGGVWMGLAAFRQLNFDECLALRAGYLIWAGEPGEPPFVMPWTILVGGIAHLLPDPAWAVRALRLLAAAGVALAWWQLLRSLEIGPLGRLATSAWLLANGVWLSHGFELRYDTALVLLLLAACVLSLETGRPRALGATLALLGLHHLKGLGLAVGWVVLLALDPRWREGPRWRRLAAGAGLTLLGWTGVLLLAGWGGLWLESQRGFLAQMAEAARVPRSASLGPVLLQDAGWWVVGAGTLLLLIASAERVRTEERLAFRLLAGAILLSVLFWWLHPRPWAYLAALPAPLLAASTGLLLRRGSRRLALLSGLALLGLVLQLGAGVRPAAAWARAIMSPLSPQLELLVRLRAHLGRGDRVLDPAGFAYFAPGCVRQWYLDTLFAERVARGEWMAELGEGLPSECTIAVSTYRLAWLPPAAQRELRERFRSLPAGLAWPRDRPVPAPLARLPGNGRVENFW